MPKVTIRVFLCPRYVKNWGKEPESWQRGWPTPADVVLELTPSGDVHKGATGTASRSTSYELPPSDDKGFVHHDDLPRGEYRVTVRDGTSPTGFDQPYVVHGGPGTTLVVGPKGVEDAEVVLLAADGRRLLRLNTRYRDGTSLPGAKVEIDGTVFVSRPNGDVYAACLDTPVEIRLSTHEQADAVPEHSELNVHRGGSSPSQDTLYVYYSPSAHISIAPQLDGKPVLGARFTLTRADDREVAAETLTTDEMSPGCVFRNVPDGTVTVTVDDAQATVGQIRVACAGKKSARWHLSPGQDLPLSFVFQVLEEETHSIEGVIQDEEGRPLAGVGILIRDASTSERLDMVWTDETGHYTWSWSTAGTFLVAALGENGEPVDEFTVEVASTVKQNFTLARGRGSGSVPSGPTPAPSGRLPGPLSGAGPGAGSVGGTGAPPGTGSGVSGAGGPGARPGGPPGAPANGSSSASTDGELSRLFEFPLLTEDISGGGRAPASRGTDRSAPYQQAVEGALRDVLGWRPGSHVSGFQAALAGAFELREVQGHTEFTWHPRGYAVQADLGALTGAQASIHNRAKNALDQITPLLTGLTPLDPAADPQDTESVRTIVRTELGELVDELAIEGGPRVQRVDELFFLLLGRQAFAPGLDADSVGGQLARLRDRFGLKSTYIATLDEERAVTNFRIVVDHLVALAVGWDGYRDLFSGTDRTSLGTVLIQLSRSLDVVAQGVEETVFALESVFIDASQRQTIRLRFPDDKPPSILLSDLLDWVVRVSTSEGPRLIREAGRDGVLAVVPVLEQLARLAEATEQLIATDPRLPGGIRTPRVRRALGELRTQLKDSADLAGFAQRTEPPVIVFVDDVRIERGAAVVKLVGRGFTDPAQAALTAEDAPEAGETITDLVNLHRSGRAVATFSPVPPGHTWLVTLINPDGNRSNTVEALRP
ncbi:carboxypeptidase regulatory-like domain-containing protein [Streptomyces sp. NPDC057474]|uniref:carboxypeptidase regulatory-like domain-containing protein n=1 Tax=Streptomyces sp. NPDC057474 TaxID=3346144 RepID=UPI0036A591BB